MSSRAEKKRASRAAGLLSPLAVDPSEQRQPGALREHVFASGTIEPTRSDLGLVALGRRRGDSFGASVVTFAVESSERPFPTILERIFAYPDEPNSGELGSITIGRRRPLAIYREPDPS